MPNTSDLMDLCDDFITDLTQAVVHGDIPGWIIYLLESLDTQSEAENLLHTVRDAIDERLEKGRW